jgi:hypothetical protein
LVLFCGCSVKKERRKFSHIKSQRMESTYGMRPYGGCIIRAIRESPLRFTHRFSTTFLPLPLDARGDLLYNKFVCAFCKIASKE